MCMRLAGFEPATAGLKGQCSGASEDGTSNRTELQTRGDAQARYQRPRAKLHGCGE